MSAPKVGSSFSSTVLTSVFSMIHQVLSHRGNYLISKTLEAESSLAQGVVLTVFVWQDQKQSLFPLGQKRICSSQFTTSTTYSNYLIRKAMEPEAEEITQEARSGMGFFFIILCHLICPDKQFFYLASLLCSFKYCNRFIGIKDNWVTLWKKILDKITFK